MDIKEAIQVAKAECKDVNAQVYLNAIPKAIEMYGSDGFETQLLYALSNMQHWTGENARNAKVAMKKYLKDKKRM